LGWKPAVCRHRERHAARRRGLRVDGDHGAAAAELDAVGAGVLRERDGELEGDHDPRRGREEGRCAVGADVGLHAAQLVAVQEPETLHAVGLAPLKQVVQDRFVAFRVEGVLLCVLVLSWC